jgi:hypothetical protein
MTKTLNLASIAMALLGASSLWAQDAAQIPAATPKGPMTFFLTSAGPGNGADLGGLAGADAHCQKLAKAVGAGSHTWRAYLSTSAQGAAAAVNARDRIGAGPWHNQAGFRVARDLAHLHGDTVEAGREGNLINQATALTEKGESVPGELNKPNQHDILTGSKTDGTAFSDGLDHTCKNWTSSAADGAAEVGHHDRQSRITSASWNSAHPSRGCSQANLVSTGGAGQFYCFAAESR